MFLLNKGILSMACLRYIRNRLINKHMSSIRKTKKAMKKSNGFFTMFVSPALYGECVMDNTVFCSNESTAIQYRKQGVSFYDSEYIPYKLIRGVRIGA